jgi:hypothetical protein
VAEGIWDVISAALTYIGSSLIRAAAWAGGKLGIAFKAGWKVAEKIWDIIAAVLAYIGSSLVQTAAWAGGKLGTAFRAGWEVAEDIWDVIAGALTDIGGFLKQSAERAGEELGNALKTGWGVVRKIWDTISNILNDIGGFLKQSAEWAGEELGIAFNTGWEGGQELYDLVRETIESLMSAEMEDKAYNVGLELGSQMKSGIENSGLLETLRYVASVIETAQSQEPERVARAVPGAGKKIRGGTAKRIPEHPIGLFLQHGGVIPAWLHPGEGVLTPQGVAALGGPGVLRRLNAGVPLRRAMPEREVNITFKINALDGADVERVLYDRIIPELRRLSDAGVDIIWSKGVRSA